MASAAVLVGEILLAAVFVRLLLDPHVALYGWIGLTACLSLAVYQIRRIVATCPRTSPRRRKPKHTDWREPVYLRHTAKNPHQD